MNTRQLKARAARLEKEAAQLSDEAQRWRDKAFPFAERAELIERQRDGVLNQLEAVYALLGKEPPPEPPEPGYAAHAGVYSTGMNTPPPAGVTIPEVEEVMRRSAPPLPQGPTVDEVERAQNWYAYSLEQEAATAGGKQAPSDTPVEALPVAVKPLLDVGGGLHLVSKVSACPHPRTYVDRKEGVRRCALPECNQVIE